MEKICERDTAAEIEDVVAEKAPNAEPLPVLEEALAAAANYQVWVDDTTGLVWCAAPEEGDSPPIVLWRQSAGEAAKEFDDILYALGYHDRVGDKTGREYCHRAENNSRVDVDDDYDVLDDVWRLYQIAAENTAKQVPKSVGQILDQQVTNDMNALRTRLGYLAARRAAHIQAVYGTEHGSLTRAAQDLGLSVPTVRELVMSLEHRKSVQQAELDDFRDHMKSLFR